MQASLRTQIGVIAALSLSLTLQSPRTIAAPLEYQILDGSEGMSFQGWAVDISGNRAIVGAPYDEGGSAYIFDVTTGELMHRLKASVPRDSQSFGHSVAIDGNLAVVTSGEINVSYVFDATTGQLLHTLSPTTPSNAIVRDVDISDGIVVLGAPGILGDQGAAFLYNALTGDQIKRIDGPTSHGKTNFGGRVAIEGNTVAITSSSYSHFGDIYVVDSQTGSLRWIYGHSTTGEYFYVKDVVIDGDRVVVGDSGGSSFDMPTAYVFDRISGTLIREIDIRVANENDDYRWQLDVSGDRLVVGSWGNYENGDYYTGAVHSFDVATGGFLGTIKNPVPNAEDNFGFAVALENERLVVGAPGVSRSKGLAYSFHIPEPKAIAMLTLGLFSSICVQRGRKRKVSR